MSYQKPEKDYGEGPVRASPRHAQLQRRHGNNIHTLAENPQDPNHLDVSQSAIAREGLSGVDRACQDEGSTGQGSRAIADQGPQAYDEKNAVW